MTKRTFHFRGESQVLDKETRFSAPGQFVDLPDGVVHYEVAGPSDAQTVVLVHGFSVPYYIWDPTFKALVEAGFRVLRYDLYGRGYSDRPDTVYDHELFDRQLLNLLSTLGIDQPVDVLGLSMGGAIAVVFTDQHPDLVRKLCLIDPAGLPFKRPFAAKLLEAPMLGEWIMSLFGDRILVAGLKDDFYESKRFPEYMEQYRMQMQYAGFKRALLSTIRSGLLAGATEAYAGVGRQDRPVMLIWGRNDQIVPFELSGKVRELIPRVEFHAIDEAGHIPHYEQSELVNALLLEFLAK